MAIMMALYRMKIQASRPRHTHYMATHKAQESTHLLDFALQMQQPVVDLYTFGLWKENILCVLNRTCNENLLLHSNSPPNYLTQTHIHTHRI